MRAPIELGMVPDDPETVDQTAATQEDPQEQPVEPQPQAPGRQFLAYLSFALMAAGLTLLFLGMRATLVVGGFCAEGGPYVVRQECPEGSVAGVLLGLVAAVLGTVGYLAYRRSGNIGGIVWPGLFLSLCWNFFEFGITGPPGEPGPAIGWLVCGAFFFVLGGGPWIVSAAVKDPGSVLRFARKFGVGHALATAAGVSAAVWCNGNILV